MADDLLGSLGLEFVNLMDIDTGLKQLKPMEELQIFSPILSSAHNKNLALPYKRHNFYGLLKRNIRCNGGVCCTKAKLYDNWINSLPDSDPRKKQSSAKEQERFIIPVVVYTGKSVQNYGGPIEIRYLDLSRYSYQNDWLPGANAVNTEIAPFFERDFIITCKKDMKSVPAFNCLETRAKWYTDPQINTEVRAIVDAPDFADKLVAKVPKLYSDEEFLNMWNSAVKAMAEDKTEAEKAVAAQQIQPAIAINGYSAQPIQVQPMQVQPVQASQLVQEAVAPQPVQATGLPLTSVSQPVNTNVPYTPQNIINGAYQAGGLTGVITPEAAINMQPTQVAPQPVQAAVVQEPAQDATQSVQTAAPQQEPVQTAVQPVQEQAPASAISQSEISLSNIQDLDALLGNIPQ